jgi:hypothetical protein
MNQTMHVGKKIYRIPLNQTSPTCQVQESYALQHVKVDPTDTCSGVIHILPATSESCQLRQRVSC